MAFGVAQTAEQVGGFIERQADNAGIGALQLGHKRPCPALDRITAGLADAFAGFEVGLDLAGDEPLEPNPAFHQPLRAAAVGRDGAESGQHPVRAPRQQL